MPQLPHFAYSLLINEIPKNGEQVTNANVSQMANKPHISGIADLIIADYSPKNIPSIVIYSFRIR